MKIRWMALRDPASDLRRMCFWSGESRHVVITGLDRKTLESCALVFDAPPGTVVHEILPDQNALDLAVRLGGALFTVPKDWQP